MEVGALRSGDPDRLGSYALIGRVGEGGQGAVFLGVDDDGRQVAIKLLHADLTSDDKARARFLRELEVAKQVAPFCTAQVIDADVDGDRPYIVSEYVAGPSLNQQVLGQGPLDGAALDRLAVGTATALAAIHQAKIVHRDFKPHNVLIGPDGPRVIDFGVARAISGGTTLTSRVIGTPSYMAPEQISGDEVGTPADVFCWAATLVFAATGEPPFGQDSIPAVINRILNEEPDLGDLEGQLRELVLDCLEKDPARRPSARQVLMRLLGHEGTSRMDAPVAAPRPSGDTDETAMLAAGSVRAAELDDGELFPPDADDDAPLFEDEPGDGPLSGSSDDWPAESTLPRDLVTVKAGAGAGADADADAGDGDKSGRGLQRRLIGSGRSAALAGAAALFVAIVVVSSVLALGSRDNGKAGQKVSDPSAPPASTDVLPSIPSTSQEPTKSRTPSYRPTTPTWTPSESPSESPTDTGSPTPSTSTSTTPPPDPS
ncbi:serine/threonine protein kinase, partial [Actinomadura sp. KC216]|uniref:serine/threonine-protein kinase n=1 Tax=Actinomadura sp. KC216 TaxID=2530370 RepID=UPI001053A20F